MIRTLTIGLCAVGCALGGGVVARGQEADAPTGASMFLSPDRVYRGPGIRPISAEVPSTVTPPAAAPTGAPPTAIAPPPRVLSGSPDMPAGLAGMPPAGCDARFQGAGDGRWQNYPPRPCWVNDQYEPEWYIGLMFGMADQGTQSIEFGDLNVRVDPQGGGVGGATFGWASGPTWLGRRRMEVELAVHTHEVDTISVENINFQVDGDLTAVSAMLNMFWDFKHPDRNWYPYVGFGVGAAQIGPISSPGDEDTDRVFAYQAMAGVTYRLRSHLELFAEGRYFGTSDGDLAVGEIGLAGIPVLPAGTPSKVSVDFDDFGVMLGARILLGKRRCVDEIEASDGRATSGGGRWRFRRN